MVLHEHELINIPLRRSNGSVERGKGYYPPFCIQLFFLFLQHTCFVSFCFLKIHDPIACHISHATFISLGSVYLILVICAVSVVPTSTHGMKRDDVRSGKVSKLSTHVRTSVVLVPGFSERTGRCDPDS